MFPHKNMCFEPASEQQWERKRRSFLVGFTFFELS